MTNPRDNTGNRRTVLLCAGLVAGMTALAFASVPLYQIFCQVTGYGGTTQRAEAPGDDVLERTMRIEFDANIDAGLPFEFAPAQHAVEVQVGEQGLAFYRAANTSHTTATGTSTFNVTPAAAGAYFVKVECFCFTEQTLKPGEVTDMPVMFYIDPDIASDEDLHNLKTITLSYTFYPARQEHTEAGVETINGTARDAL